jgi:hypothetical protein
MNLFCVITVCLMETPGTVSRASLLMYRDTATNNTGGLSGTHQLFVYSVNIQDGCVNTTKKTTDTAVRAGKEVGPEVNAEKTGGCYIS